MKLASLLESSARAGDTHQVWNKKTRHVALTGTHAQCLSAADSWNRSNPGSFVVQELGAKNEARDWRKLTPAEEKLRAPAQAVADAARGKSARQAALGDGTVSGIGAAAKAALAVLLPAVEADPAIMDGPLGEGLKALGKVAEAGPQLKTLALAATKLSARPVAESHTRHEPPADLAAAVAALSLDEVLDAADRVPGGDDLTDLLAAKDRRIVGTTETSDDGAPVVELEYFKRGKRYEVSVTFGLGTNGLPAATEVFVQQDRYWNVR